MRKSHNTINWTDNNKEYKLAKANAVNGDWCPYCGLYKNCNYVKKNNKKRRAPKRSWKSYRKHQWK